MEVSKRVRGVCKWWSSTRAYGFITAEDGAEIFCHYKEIIKNPGEARVDLEEGQPLEFEVENTFKGPAAKQIKRL